MPDATLQNDIEAIIRKAQSQPGISELMKAYRDYDEVIGQTQVYSGTQIKEPYFILSNQTS